MEIPSRDNYLQRYGIDFHLAGKQIPINNAIPIALEAVLTFYFYTEGKAV